MSVLTDKKKRQERNARKYKGQNGKQTTAAATAATPAAAAAAKTRRVMIPYSLTRARSAPLFALIQHQRNGQRNIKIKKNEEKKHLPSRSIYYKDRLSRHLFSTHILEP